MVLLIVDDEEAVRLSIRFLADLAGLGIDEVHEASDGHKAMQCLESHHVDIVITDISMPHSNGITLMSYLHSRFPDVRIIVISGYQNFEYVRESMRSGAIDYLLKPIDPEQLNRVLKEAVESIEPERGKLSGLDDMNFSALRSYIEENHQSDINLDSLASRFGFNPSYLSRRFKQKYGIGIIDYLAQVRIRHACSLLASTDLRISDIAGYVGYSDEKYFSRIFSREMHISPKNYRKRDRKQP